MSRTAGMRVEHFTEPEKAGASDAVGLTGVGAVLALVDFPDGAVVDAATFAPDAAWGVPVTVELHDVVTSTAARTPIHPTSLSPMGADLTVRGTNSDVSGSGAEESQKVVAGDDTDGLTVVDDHEGVSVAECLGRG